MQPYFRHCREQKVLTSQGCRGISWYNLFHTLSKFRLFPWHTLLLHKVSGTFQRAMNILLIRVMWQSALVWLGDITILQGAPGKHINGFPQFLLVSDDVSLELNLKKCGGFTICIDNFGHVICPGVCKETKRPNIATQRLPHPTNVMETWSIYSFSIFLRRIVQNVATLCRFSPCLASLKKKAS